MSAAIVVHQQTTIFMSYRAFLQLPDMTHLAARSNVPYMLRALMPRTLREHWESLALKTETVILVYAPAPAERVTCSNDN
jgi:hypothetical protein